MPCNEDISHDNRDGLEQHKWRAKLGKIASLSRLSITDTDQEVAELRGVLDRIAANKDGEIRVFSSQKTSISSRQATHFRAYGEFVCTAQGNPTKGKSEILRLRRCSDLDRITAHLKKVFHLVTGARIILPNDRLSGEMEQLVLSNTHFQNLLDDFVLRLPTRRMLKVIRAMLPILHNLVGGSHNDEAREEKTVLALNQLSELAQVPRNLDTMDRGGCLRNILVAVVSVVERSMSPVLVTTACKVVWKLAKSVDLRKCMLDCGLQDALWALLENIVRVIEPPERRKALEKAVTADADNVVSTDSGRAISHGEEALEGAEQAPISVYSREPLELVAGTELDELAVNSLGAVSQILRLELAKEALALSSHAGLDTLLDLATLAQDREMIRDSRVPSMAAEALAVVLISHGSFRVDWAQNDRLLSVAQLLRSEHPCVVLCGASILNACLCGEPWQIVVSPRDAAKILEQASSSCQRCLDQLESSLPSAVPRVMTGARVTASTVNSALRLRAREDTHELINTLEQTTAVCWGSLAVIERCPPGPHKPSISPDGWLSTMMTVAKLSTMGSPWVSRWVTLCALASIGLGLSAAANSKDAPISNIESLSREMLEILRKTNAIDLQEHAARALCTILGNNPSLRRKALQDGFLEKLQVKYLLPWEGLMTIILEGLHPGFAFVWFDLRRKFNVELETEIDLSTRLLLSRLGSASLDSTIACSIMFLCDVDTNEGSDDLTGWAAARRPERASMATENEETGLLTQKQMSSLVWALGHSNQDVLAYTAWTMWLLARRPENRTSLGQLWAIDGLVGALGSTARLAVKEGLLSAIWLLACDVANTARIALNGGLQIFVGILNFADKTCYVPLKTLAVGTLCTMCRFEPDVGALGMQLNLASTLLQAVYSNVSTSYLKILSAGLIFTLCRNAEHEEHRVNHLQSFIAESGQFFLEEMCVYLLSSETSELQACGAFFAASLSLNARSRHYFRKTGGVEALCYLIQSDTISEPLRLRCLHALLNLSTEPDCQVSICKWAFQTLIELVESGKSPRSPPSSLTQSDFAASILINCTGNPFCRSIMFQEQLARGSREVFDLRSAQTMQDPTQALLWANHFGGGSKSSSQIIRERFFAWVQEMKGGTLDVVRNDRDVSPLRGSLGRFGSPTPRQVIQKNDSCQNSNVAEDGHRSNKACKSNPNDLSNVESAMAKIRHDMRRPVTSLWQDETERARTAPARIRSSTSTRDLNLRLPSPQGSQARAGEFSSPGTNTGAACEGLRGGKSETFRARSDESRGRTIGSGSRKTGRPMPLRSSHRVGPVGDMGSSGDVIGENRWKPFVSKCFTKPNPLHAWKCMREPATTTVRVTSTGKVERSPNLPSASDRNTSGVELTHQKRDAMFGQAIEKHQTVVVMEPPMNYRIVFNGPTSAGPPKRLSSPASMALFPHTHGASVCAPLYEHYVSEDGLCYHLYHTSRVVCEVLDPGGYPPLSEPTELQHVLQKSLPEAPPKGFPSGKSDAKPSLYLPPTRESPAITAHYVTLCEVACRQAHWDEPCPGGKCKMFGAMPSDFLVFEVREDPPMEEHTSPSTEHEADSSEWDINYSIFASRRKEAESRSFWDTDSVVRKALDIDFTRMLKEDRVLKFLAKSDAAVANGEKTVNESLEEVKKAFAPFYKTLLAIFDFYCITSSQNVRGAFSIQPNQFHKMMQDAELAGNSISVEEIGKIFVLVNFESDKRSAEAEINEDRALMRFELMEALLRVAITVRDNEGQENMPPAEKLRSMIADQLLTTLPLEAMEHSNTFRNERLYTKACDNVLQEHKKPLMLVYQYYSLLDPVGGKPCFGLEEWKTFTSDARLVGDNVFMLRLGLREIKHPFYLARTMVSDEFKNRAKMMQLTFVDFMEALARLANAMPIPSDQDMKDAEVTDIMDYETALVAGYEKTPEYHAIVEAAIGGPLAPRLERVIRYILGNLAIRFNGVVKAGNKKMKLVGQYCTKAHIARGILP